MNTVRCTIKYHLVIAFLFMAIVASAFVSAQSPMDASNRRALSNVSQTLIKVVSPADPGYEWMYDLVGGNATLAEQVELEVYFPKGHPALVSTKGSASSIVSALVFGKMSKSLGMPDGPEPGYDGRLGQQDSTRLGCAVVSQGTNFYHADVDYEWEWRYRTDSDNDGVNDSNPGWVLTKVDIKFLQPNVASICP